MAFDRTSLCIVLGALFFVASIATGQAAGPTVAEQQACLTKAEQQAAVAGKQAVSLAQATRKLREQGKRAEVVRARLCRQGEGLVYVLTLLPRSGKVARVNVDAASGELINEN